MSPVAMSHPSPWLHPVCCYKRPLKEEDGLLPFGILFWAFGVLDFLLGFWLFAVGGFLPLNIGKKLLLWAFWCGKLLEGKRIIEGKTLKGKGKKMLKGNS
jgi:hypothetical protein